MKILICHERFLFRFGADRHFMLAGRGLAARGHQVWMAAQSFDEDVLRTFASRAIQAPSDCPYGSLDDHTAAWLEREWDCIFGESGHPDVAFLGGWPFYKAIAVLRDKGVPAVFSDVGVTPNKGQPEGVRQTLDKIRELRRRYLPLASAIVPISDFLAATQSRPDSNEQVPVTTIYPGADHLDFPLWKGAQVGARPAGAVVRKVRELQDRGRRVVLNLGRWEPGCYKNSGAALKLLDKLDQRGVESDLVALAPPEHLGAPQSLAGRVHGVGSPDDDELHEIMRLVDLNVQVSLWEGFDLPLAEAQWLERPCLVFDVGAHPEVASHPWRLCRDLDEMADKAASVFRGDVDMRAEIANGDAAFKRKFTWEAHTERLEKLLLNVCSDHGATARLFVIHANNALADRANTGVVRVTRRLGRSLQVLEQRTIFVRWDSAGGEYVLPTREQLRTLGGYNGPISQDSSIAAAQGDLDALRGDLRGAILLLPEIVSGDELRRIRDYADARGMRLAAIFYDAIATLRPELCNQKIAQNHGEYMTALADADVVLAISQYSADSLQEHWKRNGITPAKVEPVLLPGEFAGGERNQKVRPIDGKRVEMLCVSTLEPRKNHRRLLEAFARLRRETPEIDWRLTLVGNHYDGAHEIAEMIERVAAAGEGLQWMGVVDDATLHALYLRADFTVYPSEIEGFGLPILESLWHARPCICADEGVMHELASGGGCLTVDVRDPAAIALGIERLATDTALYRQLAEQAAARPIDDWRGYAERVLDALAEGVATNPRPEVAQAPQSAWERTLYPGCLTEKWQMTDSERLALTGLLARLRPALTVEIGSYWGGSLSLISQFSRSVISIDIDPATPERCGRRPNVSYLIGPSTRVAPELLAKLSRAGLPVELILIDADHSEEGVRRDICSVLTYRPVRPMIVVLHDSFNPSCRQGMLTAPWASSPYCHLVDLDFVPGRIIEHGGPVDGEMWGGLAIAYFRPDRRSGELEIRQSAKATYEQLAAALQPAAAGGLRA
ncbi:MAG: glycosyltransferase [Acidobacteria bacterium]|nr:glycosyltransferase [Acidobacteriota bacterium]